MANYNSRDRSRRLALTDQRYHDLLKGASRFFVQAEGDVATAKQAAITDILALMARYQLTTDDLG